jgi:subfamily B ATP-binding cassette protein HlyB/CyaB
VQAQDLIRQEGADGLASGLMDVQARLDSGLACLAIVMRLKGKATDYEDLRQRAGRPAAELAAGDLERLARETRFKANTRRFKPSQIGALPKPAILRLKDGRFVVLSRIDGPRALIHDPARGKPSEVPLADLEAAFDGEALLVSSGEAEGEGARFGLGWFVPALMRYKAYMAQVLLASLVIQLFALATPIFTMLLIDKVMRAGTVSTLNVLAIGLVAMALFDLVIGSMRGFLLTHTTNKIDVELGARLFRHLMSLPLAYFEKRSTGASLARVRELESIRAFLTGSALTVIIDLGFTVVFIATMWSFSARLTMIVIGILAALGIVYTLIAPALRKRIEEKTASGTDSQSFLVETIGGMATLKGMAVEPRMQQRWEELLVANTRASFRSEVLSQTTSQLAGFLNKLMVAAILWYGATLVIGGELSAGTLIAFNMMSGRVSAPAMRLAQLWQQVQHTRMSMQRVGDLLSAQSEPAPRERSSLPRISGAIELRQVNFRYGADAPPVLENLSLTIAPGEIVGIVGMSGAGKSTIIKLLQRLYVPQSGKILVDGIDIGGVDPAWLRRQVGVVAQDTFLFNLSIRENIQLADPARPFERVMEAAKLAGAHEFISQLPQAYDTVVGERGMQLSGGQRQRLAIARALLTRPRILLLDEATSSLDVETERRLHENMRRIVEGRTVVIVAHRQATMQLCDRLVVLKDAGIAEEGTPAELLALGGAFTALVNARPDAEAQKPSLKAKAANGRAGATAAKQAGTAAHGQPANGVAGWSQIGAVSLGPAGFSAGAARKRAAERVPERAAE